jgi:hypothetical protein
MHNFTLTGVVQRFRKLRGSKEKVAIIKDSHSYITIEVPDNSYVVGQTVEISGKIIGIERGTQHIRVMPVRHYEPSEIG